MNYLVLLPIIKIFILTAIAFLVSFALAPVLTHFLYKYKMGKNIRPASRSPIYSELHKDKRGTPTMGGILIWLTVLFLALLFFYLARLFPDSVLSDLNFLDRGQTLLPLGALVAASLVGLADDWLDSNGRGLFKNGLTIRHRLLIYALIALIGSLWFFFKLDWDIIHIPFWGNIAIGWWYIPVFVLVLVATSFSVNETDGLDGLAGGLLLAAFAAFGAMAFVAGRYELAAFCGAIAGALLSFLWFNINPARFFMGDTGAMGLGVTLGVVAMLTNTALFLPIISFLFVVESGSVIAQTLSKKLRGKKIFLSAPIHHHLEAVGWSEPKIVMRFWVIAAVTAAIGFVLFLVDRAFYF